MIQMRVVKELKQILDKNDYNKVYEEKNHKHIYITGFVDLKKLKDIITYCEKNGLWCYISDKGKLVIHD